MSSMTDQERNILAVPHVVHDYANLVSSGTMAVAGHHLNHPFTPPTNTHIVHAFLVNCRKMYEFFTYPPSTRPEHDDVRAGHYLSQAKTFELREWSEWHDAMNKQLMHVTYARVERPKRWEGHDENRLFLSEFMAAWKAFRGCLTGTVYERTFNDEIRAKLNTEFRSLDLW